MIKMNKLINVNRIPTVDYLSQYEVGKFRFVTKCKAGFMTVSDARDFDNPRLLADPESLLNQYKKGALYTIQFQPGDSGIWLTIFACTGKRINLIDQSILVNLTVGTINQLWYNTALYDYRQYNAVNSKNWASYAYQMNQSAVMAA
jgi:hypothetical protein